MCWRLQRLGGQPWLQRQRRQQRGLHQQQVAPAVRATGTLHTCTHAHIHAHTDTDTHIHTHARAVHLDILPAVWQPLHELAAHTQGGHCVSRTFCVYFYDTIGAVLARHMFTRSHPAMVQQAAWGWERVILTRASLFPRHGQPDELNLW